MKIRFLIVFVLVVISVYSSSFESSSKNLFYKQLPQDNKRWEKTKEQIKKDDFYHIEYISKENPQEKLLVTYEDSSDLYRRSELGEDLFSLLEKECPSALQRMKELRLELKKRDSIYSVWKLLYVFSKDDIIYEFTIPALGPYEPRYEITRLIKQSEGYLMITYQNKSVPSKEELVCWLKWLKELDIN